MRVGQSHSAETIEKIRAAALRRRTPAQKEESRQKKLKRTREYLRNVRRKKWYRTYYKKWLKTTAGKRRRALDREWQSKHQHVRRLSRRYGLTEERVRELRDGTCNVCGTKPQKQRVSFDHCHRTGKFRGVLCGNCNRALGLLQDDAIIIRNLLRYIEKTNAPSPVL